VTYTLGRRYGAARLRARLMQKGDLDDERKFEKLYAKYGMLGLFLGRWVPGVRGLVPMAAGALRISAVRTIGIVAIVAMLFYGILIGFAFSVGTNWEAFYAKITAMGKWGTIFGIALALIAVSVFLVVRRRRKASNHIR
jgi:membrane protein DedA with SNARE-associated domain